MLTLGIWAGTMALLLPSTVTAVWLTHWIADRMAHEDPYAAEPEVESIDSEREEDNQEPQFTEITSAEIDDILDYYEQRNAYEQRNDRPLVQHSV